MKKENFLDETRTSADERTMLKMRHSIEEHLVEVLGVYWYGSGVDLTNDEMDIAFDHEGRNYKILLIDKGPVDEAR